MGIFYDMFLVGLVGQIVHFQPDYQAMVAAYRAGELGEVWLVERWPNSS